jgi:hypothetical protein
MRERTVRSRISGTQFNYMVALRSTMIWPPVVSRSRWSAQDFIMRRRSVRYSTRL